MAEVKEYEENDSITWLKYMMDELDVDVKELASVLGKSERQIGRYKTDGFSHNKNEQQIKSECFKYLCQKSCFKTYHHIENRVFFRIFLNYYNALNSKPETAVTQQEMADFFGVKQKTISSWLNPKIKTKFSTERQYQILNFLFSKSMKHMDGYGMFKLKIPNSLYNFDFLGYYAVNWKLEDYLQYPEKFFYLMQNREILSRVDQLMFDYIDMPIPLYRMLNRQFEAAFRYVQYPSSERTYSFSSEYEQFDDAAFDSFLSDIRTFLINGEEQNSNIGNTILQKHQRALAKCSFLGTKQEQQSEREQIAEALLTMKITPQGKKEKDYQKLHKQLMHIVRHEKCWDTENRISPYEIDFRIEQLIEQINKLGVEEQNMIFCHVPAFLDTINFNNEIIRYCNSFEKTILYPFLRKMISSSDHERIIREIESEIFQHKDDISIIGLAHDDKRYKSIRKKYRRVNRGLQVYLSMSEVKYHAETRYRFFMPYEEIDKEIEKEFNEYENNRVKGIPILEKNVRTWLSLFPQTDIFKLILAKLDFSSEDWHLWGLIQAGIIANPRAMMRKILDFLGTPDEILTLSAEKKEEK